MTGISSLRDHGPCVPDYPRLRAEIEAGRYPFRPEDEGELFARCEHLEAENVRLVAVLARAAAWVKQDVEDAYAEQDFGVYDVGNELLDAIKEALNG